MSEPVARMECSLPDIMSAISINGAGNGARLKIDIPEAYIAEAMKVALLRGEVFLIDVYRLG